MLVPKKIGDLKSVLTLGAIDVAGSWSIMKELQKLTQFNKLGVTGVTKRNAKFSALLLSVFINCGH